VDDHGVDTVSYAFRPHDPSALDDFLAQPRRRFTRRERGSSYWATQLVGGVKLGAYPSHGLLVAEGRLAPMLSRDEHDTRLAAPDGLAVGAQRVREAFSTLGVSLDCDAVVRRLDLAAEIRFEHPADGLRFLAAMSQVDLPRYDQQRETARQTGRVTSIAWVSGGGITLRLYDAGLCHATDAPGVRLRLERQVRYQKPQQRLPGHFEDDLSALYLGPLAGLIDAARSIAVLTPRAAERALIDRYLAGDKSLAITERLLGAIRIRDLRVDETVWSDPDTRARRLRELRNEGLLLRDTAPSQAVALDVRPPLAALREVWR
jgi:hypothetical protein